MSGDRGGNCWFCIQFRLHGGRVRVKVCCVTTEIYVGDYFNESTKAVVCSVGVRRLR